jgi:hypothetical protein
MSASCNTCGKSQLNWRLQRPSGPNFKHGPRRIAWTCRSCGATWTEEVPSDSGSPQDDDASPAETDKGEGNQS